MKLIDLVGVNSGVPLFRITESSSSSVYAIYSQNHLQADLAMTSVCEGENKLIRTENQVATLNTGDIVFSLISGTAARVHPARQGYLYSHNYIVLVPNEKIDANFLVYYLNCSQDIKRQFVSGMQGSQVMKYTIQQLRQLDIKNLPDIVMQEAIGKIYMAQNRLTTLKTRLIERHNKYQLAQIEKWLISKEEK